MTLDNRHYKDEIQDLIDGRLDERLRGEVEDHLETCEACRNERRNLEWVKEQLRTKVETRELPSDVQAAITNALYFFSGLTMKSCFRFSPRPYSMMYHCMHNTDRVQSSVIL